MHTFPYRNRRTGAREVYFRCSTYQSARACRGVYSSARLLDEAVRRFVGPFELDPVRSAAAQVAGQVEISRHEQDIALLTRELDLLRARAVKMLERLDAGIITDADYVTWRAERDQAVDRLEMQIGEVRAEQERLAKAPTAKAVAGLLAAWPELAAGQPAELNALLRLWIRRIVVFPSGTDPRIRVIPVWESG